MGHMFYQYSFPVHLLKLPSKFTTDLSVALRELIVIIFSFFELKDVMEIA